MPRSDAAREPAAEPAPTDPLVTEPPNDPDPPPNVAGPPSSGLPPGLGPCASIPSTSALVKLDVSAARGTVDAGVLASKSLYEMNERRLLIVWDAAEATDAIVDVDD